jgi:hypothetical protein
MGGGEHADVHDLSRRAMMMFHEALRLRLMR